jgi:hypothetical protein
MPASPTTIVITDANGNPYVITGTVGVDTYGYPKSPVPSVITDINGNPLVFPAATGTGGIVFANSPTLTGTTHASTIDATNINTVNISVTGTYMDSLGSVGTLGQILSSTVTGTEWIAASGGGGGTVTSFSAGNLSPLFTTSVATATTTPALTFALSNAAQNSVFAGPATGGTGAPTFRALVSADMPSGLGTVTSVSFTGGLISVATATTTPALTVAGTSGGIPYFNSTSTWATSALLATSGVVIGGGAGNPPATSTALTFAAGNLTIGAAGINTGEISLAGTTSGVATITAPAVAGTTTNPIVSSNYITAPVFNATTGFTISGAATAGQYLRGNGTDFVSSTIQNADLPGPALNAQTGTTYTTVLTDANNIVTMNNAGASTFTVPPNSSVAYAVGCVLTCIQLGAGQVTLTAGAGVTFHNPSSATARVQYSTVFATQVSANTWILGGDLS